MQAPLHTPTILVLWMCVVDEDVRKTDYQRRLLIGNALAPPPVLPPKNNISIYVGIDELINSKILTYLGGRHRHHDHNRVRRIDHRHRRHHTESSLAVSDQHAV